MIVDVRTRMWERADQWGAVAEQWRRRRQEPWERVSASPAEHAAAMTPVDRALVHGFESRLLGASLPAEQVAEQVAREPERLIGIAGVDPTAGDGAAAVERAAELGLAGVCVSPGAAGFHPSDTRAMAVYEACAGRGMPMFVELGGELARDARLELAEPMLWDEPVREVAGLTLVLSGLSEAWVNGALAMLSKHANVYAELSGLVGRQWGLYQAMLGAHERGVMGQLLMASGFPLWTPSQAIVGMYSVNALAQGTDLPTVPREQVRGVIERDAVKVLGLE